MQHVAQNLMTVLITVDYILVMTVRHGSFIAKSLNARFKESEFGLVVFGLHSLVYWLNFGQQLP